LFPEGGLTNPRLHLLDEACRVRRRRNSLEELSGVCLRIRIWTYRNAQDAVHLQVSQELGTKRRIGLERAEKIRLFLLGQWFAPEVL
jgi:hypothetical protein